MSGFVLYLQSPLRCERLDDVVSFQGADKSGSFSIWPRHERFVTVLAMGLCIIRSGDGSEALLALPGGVAYFLANELKVSTRYYERGADAATLLDALRTRMESERAKLARTREAVLKLERQLLRQIWAAAREAQFSV